MSPSPIPTPPEPAAAADPTVTDLREQLVNGRECGPIDRVSIPEVMIATLHGIMLDFDPELYDPARLPAGATDSPQALFELFVGPMLARHPALAGAEVRDTGRGLHAIVWLDPPVAFETEDDRDRWAAVVKVVQLALPTDPNAPGITALTRPTGSVNGKTGRKVAVLKAGTPVAPEAVLRLAEEVRLKPAPTVARILFGDRTSPCPVCRTPGSRLGVGDRAATCYGCGRVTVGKMFDAIYKPRSAAGEEARG